MKFKLLFLLLCFCHQQRTDGARILGAFIFPSYSHQSVYETIWKELANRGHELVIITTNPVPDLSLTNVQQIDISYMHNIWKKQYDGEGLSDFALGKLLTANHFRQIGIRSAQIYEHPEVQAIVKNDTETFDLLMVDMLYPAMIALSVKFKCPYVGLSSLETMDPVYKDMGNYIHPVVYPFFSRPTFDNDVSFWWRLQATEFSIWLMYFYDSEVYPTCDKLVKKYLGENYPAVKDIAANVSLLFVNSNPIFTTPRPNIAKIIEFSGVHLKKSATLPQDIQEFLDNATEGVVYFSLGSNIHSHQMPMSLKRVFLNTFRELSYKVLWKFHDSSITTFPNNVKTVKWLPQQAVLSHPNVKVFITQGGLQSLEEAIRKRVPLIGMPFYADQPRNMNNMKMLGIGQVVDKNTLTETSFRETIIEVIENPRYQQKIAEVANMVEDQMVQPLDKITWWMEYVIRHKGVGYLRSPLLDVPLYQYYLSDVLAFVICASHIFLYVVYKLLKILYKNTFRIFKSKLD